MIKGLYTAASGMTSQQIHVDLVANNLANATTAGFKQEAMAVKAFPKMLMRRMYDDHLVMGMRRSSLGSEDMLSDLSGTFDPLKVNQAFDPTKKPVHDAHFPFKEFPATPKTRTFDLAPPIGHLTTGAQIEEIKTWYEQGPLNETGKPLDTALFGSGFFKITTPGGVRYTRNGTFTINALGELVTHTGHKVLSVEDLPIVLDTQREVSITQEGAIYQGDRLVGQLAVVDFEDYKTTLTKDGDSHFRKISPAVPELKPLNVAVRQGYLENSNFSIVDGMVRLISAMRTYEASQKILQQTDGTLDRAMEVGRPVS